MEGAQVVCVPGRNSDRSTLLEAKERIIDKRV